MIFNVPYNDQSNITIFSYFTQNLECFNVCVDPTFNLRLRIVFESTFNTVLENCLLKSKIFFLIVCLNWKSLSIVIGVLLYCNVM